MPAKFDFHLHTLYSDGRGSHLKMAEIAEARKMEAVAFADHGPELIVGISKQRLQTMLQDIQIAREAANIPVLAGIEANITDRTGRVDVEKDFAKNLDFLMVAIHYISGADTYMSYQEIAREYLQRAVQAMLNNDVKILAHPFYLYRPLLPYISVEDTQSFLKLAADRGVAMEINAKYRYPPADFISLCLGAGVKLSIGSDAHSMEEVGQIEWALSELEQAGAKREDLVLDQMLIR